MHSQRRPHFEEQQQVDPAWELVRRVPGLCNSAADKLAWLYCWNKSGRGRRRITVSPGEIAADQGVTSDAGRQRIKNLLASGLLILVGNDRFTGVYTIEMADPGRVMQARAIPWDGQLDLPFASEGENRPQASIDAGRHEAVLSLRACGTKQMSGEEPPEVPPEEPRPTHLTFRGLDLSRPLPSTLASSNQVQDSRRASDRRGSSGGSSEATAEAELLADIARRQAEAQRDRPEPTEMALGAGLAATMARLAEPPDPVRRAQRIESIRTYIVQRVACPKLCGDRPLKLAELVVDGRMPERELLSLLSYLDKARPKLRSPASCYFNTGARRLISRFGATD